MIIGFDGSRAFLRGRTGTENYSYQLLKALAKLDRKNQYVVYIRSNSVILIPPVAGEGSLARLAESAKRANASDFLNKSRDSSLASSSTRRSGLITQNDNERWPSNFQFKVIPWPRLWTQGGLALQTFKDKLDVLFVPAHTLPLIRKPGLKTVVTVHDLGSEYLPSMHQIKQRLYLGFMQKAQLQTATKIIAVSKATKEDLVKRLGIETEKVKVVYEGYDRKKFQIPKSKFQKDRLINILRHYDLVAGNYFLFVGTVQPRKNLERLIKAFSIYSSRERSDSRSCYKNINILKVGSRLRSNNNITKLVLAGSRGWLSDEIYKLPKKLGIEGRVKFLGYVPEKDLPVLYSGAIALIFPSLFEGFGLPILEAQACGCPVLTSNVSSMPEIAGKGAVYVNPYSVDDIVEGMQQINNQDTRNKLIKTGFENVKRFSWEKCAKETLDFLLEIAGS